MKILVPAGVGDYSWMHSKLSTLGVDLDVVIIDAGHPRLAPFLGMLPCVKSISSKKMSFRDLRKSAIPASTSRKALLSCGGCISIEANTFLENGNRLEGWLPDMALDFHYKVNITNAHIAAAEAQVPTPLTVPFPFLCIYAANISTCKNWGGWMGKEWAEFLQAFRGKIADIPIALVGAEWDRSLADDILDAAKKRGIQIVDLVGKLELGATFHIIRSSAYFVSFPSGLAVLANVMNRPPTTMFYPKVDERLMGTWADPETIKSGEFNECLFPAPAEQVKWLRDRYRLQEKLE